jgi:hypothetical protein
MIAKQSPIKKILFVKNLCYKSNKNSKASSLDKKDNTSPASVPKYTALNNYGLD